MTILLTVVPALAYLGWLGKWAQRKAERAKDAISLRKSRRKSGGDIFALASQPQSEIHIMASRNAADLRESGSDDEEPSLV